MIQNTRLTSYQLLAIIGAARSGTKLLRDLLATHPDVAKIPYDVNYVWRFGNGDLPHDELGPEMLTSEVRQRIVRYFANNGHGAPFLVEKTVSNCLRVPYVHAIFPDALFVHLVRDGRDVVESAYRQWLAPPDWSYILKKGLAYPLVDAFGYALSYAGRVLRRALPGRDKVIGVWGPSYEGIQRDLADKELLEVCAIQWARSVESAVRALDALPAHQVILVRYEELVRNPRHYLVEIADSVGMNPLPFSQLDPKIVSLENIGKGTRRLTPEQQALVLPHIERSLVQLSYA